MTLRCLFFGHLRSRSRATIDEKNGRWLSECKRCRAQLARHDDGKWLPIAARSGRLVPVDPPAEESASASGGASEAPFIASPAADSADGDGSSAAERREQAIELTTL